MKSCRAHIVQHTCNDFADLSNINSGHIGVKYSQANVNTNVILQTELTLYFKA